MNNLNNRSFAFRRGYLLTRARRLRFKSIAVTRRGAHRGIICSHDRIDEPVHEDKCVIVDQIAAADVAKLRRARPYGKIAASPNV